MVRLRNKTDGVVVNVDDDTAGRLGPAWAPADPVKKAPAKKAEPKSEK